MKVLATDHVPEVGIEPLRDIAQVDCKFGIKPEDLITIIGDYDALLVRSQTKVTKEVIQAGKKLQVIARAGVGIDNVDVEEATHHGIVVVNAPTGNTISAAEHAVALMLAMARYIPQANASLKSGLWKRTEFTGVEVRGKTLGVIGLGNVGSNVARRARGFEMKILGFDPFVSADYASKIQVELVPLEQLLKESDFISLHIPLIASTKGLIGAKEIAMLKPGARIINTARGGLIDEDALVKAVKEKKIAGAAIDVFTQEPCTKSILFEPDNIIVTPHLGASTAEAQVTATRDVVEQIIDVFNGCSPRYAVNAPLISAETLSILAPFGKVGTALGGMISQLIEGQLKTIQIRYDGEIANCDTTSLKATVVGGLLEGVTEERVNLINANFIAAQRGISVVEQKSPTCENYTSMITVEAITSKGTSTVAGTVLRNETHIVRLNDYWIDIVPTGGYFLFSDHLDRPGILGAIGKITGDADINISAMQVSRLKPRGQALMVLALDETLSDTQRKKMLAVPDVYTVKIVKL
jgi:D-3-phosphoglycerate dehydrogenase / 2-oxoglutarate reductase